MRRIRHSLAIGIAAAVFGLLSGRGPAQAQPTEFKIGWVLPLIGPVAETAKAFMDGSEVALAMINDAGGIGGLKARIIICDSQNQEQQAVICTKKLINDDQVNLLLGATGTPPTIAILPTVEAAGIPTFAIAAGSVAWEPVKKWVFKAIAANDDQIPAEMDFLKLRGWTHAALIRDNSVFGKDTSDIVHAMAKQQGVDIVADEIYSPTDTDVTAQVTRLRALNPDIVLNLAQNLTAAVLVSKKIVQLGMKTPIMLGTNNVVDSYARLVPAAVGQSYFAGSKLVLRELPANDKLYGTITAFLKRYKEMRGADAKPTANTIPVADVLLLTATVAKPLGAKVLDRAALRDAIEGAHGIPGLQGIWTFSPTEHGSSLADGVVVVRYDNGEWKIP
jgi:branched-chain amino acid transport system substrate-binding protein